jgi:hypothetical protein
MVLAGVCARIRIRLPSGDRKNYRRVIGRQLIQINAAEIRAPKRTTLVRTYREYLAFFRLAVHIFITDIRGLILTGGSRPSRYVNATNALGYAALLLTGN